MDCQIPGCERDALNGETFCGFHGGRIHFTNRRCFCDACITERKAEHQTEPMLRLLQLRKTYSDDVLLMMDIQDDFLAALAA